MLYEVITMRRIHLAVDQAETVIREKAHQVRKGDLRGIGGVITSYSIHYTKLYDTVARKRPVSNSTSTVVEASNQYLNRIFSRMFNILDSRNRQRG